MCAPLASDSCTPKLTLLLGTDEQIAAFIKKEADKRWGATWHVVVGKSFGSYVTHTVSPAHPAQVRAEVDESSRRFCCLPQSGNFIYMYINQLAFVCPSIFSSRCCADPMRPSS